MQANDVKLAEIGDFGLAFRMLTTLPVEVDPTSGRNLLAVWAFPLVGLALGLIAALAGKVLFWLGMGPGLSAAAVLLALAALTGCRHEAALLRAIGSLFGPRTEAEPPLTLETLASGTSVLGLLSLARWSALTGLIAAQHGIAPVLAAAALSRACLPVMLVALPPAGGPLGPLRTSALAPPRASAALALVIALALALFCLGWTLIPAVAAAGVVAVIIGVLGHLRLGGRSPELASASVPLIELAIFAALYAAL